MNREELLAEAVRVPWAMDMRHLPQLMAVGDMAAGDAETLPEPKRQTTIELHPLAALEDDRPGSQTPSQGAVAVIPLNGPVGHKDSVWARMGYMVSTEGLTKVMKALGSNPEIKAIVLDVNSPGGIVFGLAEAADAIRGARENKPVVAVVNDLMASAAYWLGAQASEIVATPTSLTGSIGVWSAHGDFSKAFEMAGITVTLVAAGKYKVEGNPYEPLSDEARASMQAEIDDYYGMFLADVAKGRATTVNRVKADFGQGRVLRAKEAVAVGMVDRVGTLASVIEKFTKRRAPRGNRSESMARLGEALTASLAKLGTDLADAFRFAPGQAKDGDQPAPTTNIEAEEFWLRVVEKS